MRNDRRNQTWDIRLDIEGVEYDGSVLVDLVINRTIADQEFIVGSVNMAKLTIKLTAAADVPQNARIVPYVGIPSENMTWQDCEFAWQDADFAWGGGSLGWIPLGEFFVDRRKREGDMWIYECWDTLYRTEGYLVSQLSYPATMQDVWDEICTELGFTYDSSVVIDPTYTIPAGPLAFTVRQTMGFIAGANGASVCAGRDGTITFKRYDAVDTPVFAYSEGDYFKLKQTNPIKSYSCVIIQDPDDSSIQYMAGSGSADHTLIVTNPYGSQQMADNLLAQLDGFAYMPIDLDSRGYPHLEPGDVISVEQTESPRWGEANVVWEDADFSWNGVQTYQTIILTQKMSYRGGIRMGLAAESRSEQRSEYPTVGPLTQAVNRLRTDAVMLDQVYYGASFGRTEGFKVQREDNPAKAVLNADELAFYKANGQRGFYYDAVNDRFTLSGHLEAATGTFAGSLSAASGTFTGIVQAGTINSSTINGGTISGTAITGGTITGGAVFGGSINGTTITGGTIQTQGSGSFPRIELSSSGNLLTAQTDANNTLSVHAQFGSQPAIRFNSSTGGFWDFTQSGDTFNMTGSSNVFFNTVYGRIDINAPGGVYANGIRLDV